MMKRSFTLLLGLMAAYASAQTKYSVEIGGKSVGTASLTQKIGADGSKSVELKMDLQVNNQKLTIRSQNSYDKLGNPTRKFMDSNIPGGLLQKQIITTFNAQGAAVIQIDGGKRTTRDIPLVSTAPRVNPSEFWFVRDRPKAGQEVKCYMFNMDSLSWQLNRVVYRGIKSIKVGETTVKAHEVETIGERPAKAYVDDAGIPWLMEAGSATLKRTS